MRAIGLMAASVALATMTVDLAAATRNGDLDRNFGTNGLQLVDIGDGFAGYTDMALDAQGRIILAGSTNTGPATGWDFAVARLLPDGSPDLSFSFDGKAELAVGPGDSQDLVFAVLVQHDGRIVVAGLANSPTSGNGQDMAFARFLANGDVDTSFGAGGKVFIHFGLAGGSNGADTVRGLAQLPDGKLIGAGFTAVLNQADDMAIVKLNTDGTRDTSFGSGGRVTVSFALSAEHLMDQASSVAIDSAGRIVVAGVTAKSTADDLDFAVARLLPNGQLDPNFSGDGRATVAFDMAANLQDMTYGLHVDPDGSVVLVGSAMDVGQDIAIARLRPDGSLDPAFGNNGKVTIPFDLGSGNTDVGFSIGRHPDGRYFIVGITTAEVPLAHCLATQLLPNGQLDPGFGVVGKAYFMNAFGGAQFGCTRAKLHGDRLLVGGLADTLPNVEGVGLVAGAILIDVLFSDGYDDD